MDALPQPAAVPEPEHLAVSDAARWSYATAWATTDRSIALGVSILGAGLLSVGLTWGLAGGKGMVCALRVLAGEVPYRDFWTIYAPGHFYVIAGLLKIFGSEEIVQRIAAALVGGAIGGASYLLARELGTLRSASVLTALVVVAMRWRFGIELDSYAPAILCVLATLYLIIRYLRRGGATLLYWAGVVAGLGACFKHDVGGYAGFGVIATFFVARAVTPHPAARWHRPAAAASVFAAGCATVLLPVIWILGRWCGAAAWHDLIVFPMTGFIGVHREAYPGLVPDWSLLAALSRQWTDVKLIHAVGEHLGRWVVGNMAHIALAGGCVWLLAVRKRGSATMVASLVLLLCCGILYWLAAHVRQQTHVYSIAICALLMFGLAWSRLNQNGVHRRLRWLVTVLAAVYVSGLLVRPAMLAGYMSIHAAGSRRVELAGVRGISIPAAMEATYWPIVEFVRTQVPADERIYVGATRHDFVDVRMPGSTHAVYLLAGRLNGCRYDELHPGVTDQAAVQAEIVEDLNRHNVHCLILWKLEAPTQQDTAPASCQSQRPGASLLDSFIEAEFEVVLDEERYVVMWRQGGEGKMISARGCEVTTRSFQQSL